MSRKLVWGLLILPLAVVLIALAVVNRQQVALVLDPLNPSAPALSIEAPFFLHLLLSLALGVVVGGAVTWWRQRPWRRLARQRDREAAALRQENDRLKHQIDAMSPPRLPNQAA